VNFNLPLFTGVGVWLYCTSVVGRNTLAQWLAKTGNCCADGTWGGGGILAANLFGITPASLHLAMAVLVSQLDLTLRHPDHGAFHSTVAILFD